ncbi:MAG: nitroreductase family protein [Smithellaceae bacterium]|nr:nitroreductase family protein [Smithellaceae bacterium]
MERTVTTVIDEDKCTGCGLCVKVCPSGTITMEGKKAKVTGASSLSCGHCVAVCPVDAIRVGAIDSETCRFENFPFDERWLPHGEYDTTQLVRLMQSRRSCRNFRDLPVGRTLLDDLVKIGMTAPSGSNCQCWSFTVLPDRKAVVALGEGVISFFRKVNTMAEKSHLRMLAKLFGKDELNFYYREYYEKIKERIEQWERDAKDSLFHGAPAAILVGSTEGASCPVEDALLASQNILLSAHSMGLGSCLVGYAVTAMKKDPQIKKLIGIPESETVHAVMALGHPAESYQRVVGRKKAVVRYYSEGADVPRSTRK